MGYSLQKATKIEQIATEKAAEELKDVAKPEEVFRFGFRSIFTPYRFCIKNSIAERIAKLKEVGKGWLNYFRTIAKIKAVVNVVAQAFY
jgi:hypothetical protein